MESLKIDFSAIFFFAHIFMRILDLVLGFGGKKWKSWGRWNPKAKSQLTGWLRRHLAACFKARMKEPKVNRWGNVIVKSLSLFLNEKLLFLK